MWFCINRGFPVLFNNKQNWKRFVISALPDSRSITGPRASRTFLFRLWLFVVLFMSFSAVFPSLVHLLNALLGGKGAPSPARPLLGTNYCRIYQIIQKYWRNYRMVSCTFYQIVRKHCRIYYKEGKHWGCCTLLSLPSCPSMVSWIHAS